MLSKGKGKRKVRSPLQWFGFCILFQSAFGVIAQTDSVLSAEKILPAHTLPEDIASTLLPWVLPLPCPEGEFESRLTSARLVQQEKRVRAGDSVLISVEGRQIMTLPLAGGPDTILLVEQYHLGKSWKVFRYRIAEEELLIEGPQLRFNRQGQLDEILQCPEGVTVCRHWTSLIWWPNGQLAKVGGFHNGKPDRLHRSWYDNGRLRSAVWYVEGRLHQVEAMYDREGVQLAKGTFRDGNGCLPVYSMNGQLIEQRLYRRGRIVRKCRLSE